MPNKKNYLQDIGCAKVSVFPTKDLLVIVAYMLYDVLGELQRINLRIDQVDKQ